MKKARILSAAIAMSVSVASAAPLYDIDVSSSRLHSSEYFDLSTLIDPTGHCSNPGMLNNCTTLPHQEVTGYVIDSVLTVAEGTEIVGRIQTTQNERRFKILQPVNALPGFIFQIVAPTRPGSMFASYDNIAAVPLAGFFTSFGISTAVIDEVRGNQPATYSVPGQVALAYLLRQIGYTYIYGNGGSFGAAVWNVIASLPSISSNFNGSFSAGGTLSTAAYRAQMDVIGTIRESNANQSALLNPSQPFLFTAIEQLQHSMGNGASVDLAANPPLSNYAYSILNGDTDAISGSVSGYGKIIDEHFAQNSAHIRTLHVVDGSHGGDNNIVAASIPIFGMFGGAVASVLNGQSYQVPSADFSLSEGFNLSQEVDLDLSSANLQLAKKHSLGLGGGIRNRRAAIYVASHNLFLVANVGGELSAYNVTPQNLTLAWRAYIGGGGSEIKLSHNTAFPNMLFAASRNGVAALSITTGQRLWHMSDVAAVDIAFADIVPETVGSELALIEADREYQNLVILSGINSESAPLILERKRLSGATTLEAAPNQGELLVGLSRGIIISLAWQNATMRIVGSTPGLNFIPLVIKNINGEVYATGHESPSYTEIVKVDSNTMEVIGVPYTTQAKIIDDLDVNLLSSQLVFTNRDATYNQQGVFVREGRAIQAGTRVIYVTRFGDLELVDPERNSIVASIVGIAPTTAINLEVVGESFNLHAIDESGTVQTFALDAVTEEYIESIGPSFPQLARTPISNLHKLIDGSFYATVSTGSFHFNLAGVPAVVDDNNNGGIDLIIAPNSFNEQIIEVPDGRANVIDPLVIKGSGAAVMVSGDQSFLGGFSVTAGGQLKAYLPQGLLSYPSQPSDPHLGKYNSLIVRQGELLGLPGDFVVVGSAFPGVEKVAGGGYRHNSLAVFSAADARPLLFHDAGHVAGVVAMPNLYNDGKTVIGVGTVDGRFDVYDFNLQTNSIFKKDSFVLSGGPVGLHQSIQYKVINNRRLLYMSVAGSPTLYEFL